MDKLLKRIEEYKRVVIVSDNESVDLSNMVYEVIVRKFTDMCEFFRKARMKTYSPKYKYFDMFFEDNHKGVYRKFKGDNIGNIVLRVKGNGFNIDGLGLEDSHGVFYKSDLTITVKNGIVTILTDKFSLNRRVCDTDVLYRSYKISKLLNNINGSD